MQAKCAALIALTAIPLVVLAAASVPAQTKQADTPYPAMAPIERYQIADSSAEIALAKTAAPKSIADAAEVLVLGPDGYTSAIKGTNGFVCLVERSWAAATDAPEFWNPHIRAPVCLNAPAARGSLPIVKLKTKLVLAGTSRADIAQAVATAFDRKELPDLEPGAFSYMMSKQQYLTDAGKNWHPHLMWFVPGDAAAAWGANLPGSPALASNDPEEHMTVFYVWAGHWSDGSPFVQGTHRVPAAHTMH
jgi:hypothetical protein